MKNLGKDLNKAKKLAKRKLTKEDLKQFTPDRIVKDLNMVEQLVSKMGKFDENIKEDEAEKFAEFIFNKLNPFVQEETNGRVKVKQVEFKEHGKNSAIYSE